MSALPEGWIETSLGDLLDLNYGKALKKDHREGGDVPVYGSNGVVGFHSQSITDAPAIIVGRKGSIGEVHFSDRPCFPIDTTYYIDDFPATTPEFAVRLLKHLNLNEMDRATAIPGLNRNDAYGRKCPLPPLAEQRRIVEKLDSLTAQNGTAAAALTRLETLITRYKAAVLAQYFETDAYPHTTLGELGQLHCGQSPKSETVNREGKGTLYVTGPEQWDGTEIEAVKWTTDPKRIVPDDCIFITVKGSGVGTLFPGITCAIGRDVYAYEPGDCISFEFAHYSLLSTILELKAKAHGTIPGLSKPDITDHETIIPPLEEQAEIVARIEAAFAQIETLTRAATAAHKRLDRLNRAILARAFRGDLVPQDPNDEPAGELLKRVKEITA